MKISDERRRQLKTKGFLASTEIIYDFNTYGEAAYLSNRKHHSLHPFSKGTSALIDNKAFIPCLFSSAIQYMPKICLYLADGVPQYCIGADNRTTAKDQLVCLLKKCNDLFAKKVNSSGGNDNFQINADNLHAILPHLRKGRWLVNDRLHNEAYSNQFSAQSINTLRVVFFRASSGEPRIFRIFHRFGTLESGPVDNCCKGGMVCAVDLGSGRLSKAVIYGSREKNGWHVNHVDNNRRLEGFEIPGWNGKLAAIQDIVNRLFYLNYGGIDLALTDKGVKILEINSLPTMLITQMQEPALLDGEFADFIARADQGSRRNCS